MKKNSTSYWPITLGGLVVVLLGGWTMYQEAAPNLRGGNTAIARLANMPDGDAPIGLTVLSQHRALLDCEELSRSSSALEMQYLGPEQRERLVGFCGQMAEAILAKSPADSFAWLTLASARASQGDMAQFNLALVRSQLSGPNEGWLANMRAQVAEANLATLSDIALTGHDHDLQVAASIGTYARNLARRYVADEGFRARMTKVLETMGPNEQRRFLSAVRSALTATGR